jgi:DnaK suppressor protein
MDQQSLGRFRKALKERRDAVHLRLILAREQDRAQNRSEVTDEADRGIDHVNREMYAIQQTQAGDFLEAINEALDRIDDGTFGECRNCGQEIGMRRLEAIPWAQYCITCQVLITGG